MTFTAKAKATPDFDGDGEVGFSDFFLFAESFGQPARAKLLAMARERIGLPEGPQLLPNAPNPFNSGTVLSWFQLQPGEARLEVFALTGQGWRCCTRVPRRPASIVSIGTGGATRVTRWPAGSMYTDW